MILFCKFRPRHSHYTNDCRSIYPTGLQINLTSARSGFRVSRWKRETF